MLVITLHITHRYDIKPKEDLVNMQSPIDHFVQQSVFSKSERRKYINVSFK